MRLPIRRRTLWKISHALEELRLPDDRANDPGSDGRMRDLLRRRKPRHRIWLERLFTAAAAGLMLWDPFSIGRSGHGSFALLVTSSLQGYRGRLDDPRFPSGRTLSQAGLSLIDSESLGLPGCTAMAEATGSASQVLRGRRHGREVRSGIHSTPDGRVVVRTGISAEPPCFSCEIVEGHLLSTNAPVALDRTFLSKSTGPGRITIFNDGSWLVVDRLLPVGYKGRRAMLLLRQLHDISLAERLCGSTLPTDKAAFV